MSTPLKGSSSIKYSLRCNKMAVNANFFFIPVEYVVAYWFNGKSKMFLLSISFIGIFLALQSNWIYSFPVIFSKKLGKTVIISSHIFSTLSDTCDEINLLSEGSIVKSVQREDFQSLETEMKQMTVGNRIEKLGLH